MTRGRRRRTRARALYALLSTTLLAAALWSATPTGTADAAASGGTLTASGFAMSSAGEATLTVGRSGDKPHAAFQLVLVTRGVVTLGKGYQAGISTDTPGVCGDSYPSGSEGDQVRTCGLRDDRVLTVTGTGGADTIRIVCSLDFSNGDCPEGVVLNGAGGNDVLGSRHSDRVGYSLRCGSGNDSLSEYNRYDSFSSSSCEHLPHPADCPADTCRSNSKGGCTVQAFTPRANGQTLFAEGWFTCDKKRNVRDVSNYLYTDVTARPDKVIAEGDLSDVDVKANTWYSLTATYHACDGGTRHTTVVLGRSDWAASLKVDSPHDYVFC